jgi:hypothetical protein
LRYFPHLTSDLGKIRYKKSERNVAKAVGSFVKINAGKQYLSCRETVRQSESKNLEAKSVFCVGKYINMSCTFHSLSALFFAHDLYPHPPPLLIPSKPTNLNHNFIQFKRRKQQNLHRWTNRGLLSSQNTPVCHPMSWQNTPVCHPMPSQHTPVCHPMS